MAEGLNKAMLIGNLGADPELKFTANNRAVLKLRLATTESYLADNNERKEVTHWHNVVLWGKRGEALSKLLSKGSRIYVEGRIENRSYDDKDGVKRSISEISASNVVLLDGKREGAPAGSSERSAAPRAPAPPSNGGGDAEEDIPF